MVDVNLPTFSLLMPAYNGVRWLKYAVDSVIRQTYQQWELVIVDDRSVDGTYELACKLSETDTRIRVYQNEHNVGIVKNRKRCYQYSIGDLIGHFDQDDLLERYALEEMFLAFDADSNVQLIYSDLSQIGEEGEHQLYGAAKNFDANKLYDYGWRHFGVYRRAIMKHISGYNEQLVSACEDGDLFMQIAEKDYKIVRLPKPLYYHRAHGKNNSKNNKECKTCEERSVCNYIRVWDKAYKQWELEQK